MNLYLYILPHSAHPPGLLTGLVSGNILCIHSLCRNEDDINRHMKEFYARLLVCGYQRDLLIPSFAKGITGARVRQCVSDQEKKTKFCVFFHLTYHPRDPTTKNLQRQWRQHLLHPPWESPLWTLKNKAKIPFVSTRCVWHTAAPKILAISSRTVRLIVSICPLSPPILSRDWGLVIFQ